MTQAATLRPFTPIRSPAGSSVGTSAAAMAITTTNATSRTLKAIGQRLRLEAPSRMLVMLLTKIRGVLYVEDRKSPPQPAPQYKFAPRSLSALGQKLPRDIFGGVAALPPKADANAAGRHVRHGPLADVTPMAARL